ncbi:hypothetical protein [Salinactinospora qingdaonensis]
MSLALLEEAIRALAPPRAAIAAGSDPLAPKRSPHAAEDPLHTAGAGM